MMAFQIRNVDLMTENMDLNKAPSSLAHEDPDVSKIEVATQTECKSPEKERRAYFIDQATCTKNCYRYTCLTRAKLDLAFEYLELKVTEIHYWRGGKNAKSSSKSRKPKQSCCSCA